ncbi:fumarate reductase/succinate dehydrogenase flavoprotein subunit [Zhaonella formicivorans]|uniref:fumarate reductase/succinate dehydrogenase flavoprotein subunit n=1 Tax=Zhaonella formicivorans TaxID=2528593 RepID=UPI001D0FB186|nr:fumarate reductase/succinate dehydrogenase flavoprotein subunit [Zhaonella formicivorans]
MYITITTDVLIIGGGSAGTYAAIKAKEKAPELNVLVLEKAHIERSGAIARGMDAVNNAVVPGVATPEKYVEEVTKANDGVLDQETCYVLARQSYPMLSELESWGVKFPKDENGNFIVHHIHPEGRYTVPMDAEDLKKILAREVVKRGVEVLNRHTVTSLLTREGKVTGATALNTRTGEFVVVNAKAVVLTTGAAGRFGLPASGYLTATYEFPGNAGDGYAMAYRAGAELTGLECFQINPLIKDYNGPSCGYVVSPYGGYMANAFGERFTTTGYWSGHLLSKIKEEIDAGRGPVYLKMNHLDEETIRTLENILYVNERPSRGKFNAGRRVDIREHMVELHLSEPTLCSGHSSSGVWVNERAESSVPGLFVAGDVACVPHQYLAGAFVFGGIAGSNAAEWAKEFSWLEPDPGQIEQERDRVFAPLQRKEGIKPALMEYKLRKTVSDYLFPPKTEHRLDIALERFRRFAEEDLPMLYAADFHELGKALEVECILDCAIMAAEASKYRKESRWGFLHLRADYPERDDANWLKHVIIKKNPAAGKMEIYTKPVRVRGR